MGGSKVRLILEDRAPPKMRLLPQFIDPDPRVGKIRIGSVDGRRILPMFGKMIFVAETRREILLKDRRFRLYGTCCSPCGGAVPPQGFFICYDRRGGRCLVIKIRV